MVHTYKSLRDQVLRMIGEDGDTVPETVVKDLMNQAHMQRVTQHPWPFMVWPKTETITVASGTRAYALHQEYGKGIEFYDTTNNVKLREVGWREELSYSPERFDGVGDPGEFDIHGTQQVAVQLTTNGTIKISSSSASDNSSTYNVIIKGETSTGDITSETITPNGVTPVAGTITWRSILGVTKITTWNGTMTLATSGGTTLLTLYATEMGRTYQVFNLHRTPEAAATIQYRFFQKPLFLDNDYDVPQLPDYHAQILVWDTLLLMAGYIGLTGDLTPWVNMQQKLERNLYKDFGFQGQSTLNAGPTYVSYSGDS